MAQVVSSTTAGPISLPTRISARGVIAGVLVALAIDLLMLTFGAAIGLSAMKPNASSAEGAAIWGVIWFLITSCASGFFGGWVAASASGLLSKRDGVLHGFVAWAGGAVLLAMFLVGALAGTARVAANAASNVAPSLVPQAQQQLQQNAPAQNPQQQQQIKNAAGSAANYLGLSSWGLFVSLALSCGFSILGGAVGAGIESKERRYLVEERTTTVPPVPAA